MLMQIIGLVIAAVLLYFPYVWCKFRHEDEKLYGLKWFLTPSSKRDLIFALVFTLAPLTFISIYWPPEWGRGGIHNPELLQALDMAGGGVAAAFIEETFFRGWLQTILARHLKIWLAIFLTALIFSLSHLILITGWLRVATFFPGLIMGILRHRGKSVLPGIIYHAICNIWAVWFAPIV